MSRRSVKDSGVDGCIICDKPAGMTSHDVVDLARTAFGTRKVGHAGTLDPDATGVLVIGVGVGTKLLQFVTGVDKTYEAQITFGSETSTLDAAGDVTATHEMNLEPAQVRRAAARFVGDIEQVPPMVSAIRIGGKRLYELAREGKEVERKARPVKVYEFGTSETPNPLVYNATVSCSSGTYVRTLAADLGFALGGGAHLSKLRRTSVGGFTLGEACPVDELLIDVEDKLLRGMPLLKVDDDVAFQVRNGRPLGPTDAEGHVAVKNQDDRLLAVYHAVDGQLVPARVLPLKDL